MLFKERIREHYDEMTPGFRKLADFIMDQTLDVAFLTATQLSRRVGVDPATVVRFSQDLDYSGYRELSREIKGYVRDQVTSTYREVEDATTEEELLKALTENAEQNMEHFVATDMVSLVNAVEVLKGASHIWLTGEFGGYDIANFVAKKFKSHGVSASVFHPGMSETASAISQMKEGEALLTIAEAAPSLDAGYAVRMAREKGLKTVTISCSGVILPAREAEVTVITPCDSPVDVASFGTLMQVLSLMWEAVLHDQKIAEAEDVAEGNLSQLLKLRAETPEYEVENAEDEEA
ncbi:MAG: MurR/RpiR family transcriptional regulator [Anaerolineales bacterium]